ncbi:MAG: UDPGP type 1 family protein [Planctomycetota bacterium]|nr:UDPGP type 1 family protein [Planctomycetota bacterium]
MAAQSIQDRFVAAHAALAAVAQEHVLASFAALSDAQKAELLDQIDNVDWPEVARLVKSHVLAKPHFALPANVAPAPWYANVPPADQAGKYQQARKAGEELVRAGKVAAFTVAGGQGTRLGWNGPKGTFPATPVRNLSLFQSMGEYLLNAARRWGKPVPWYVMTSPANHQATTDYFTQNDFLGLGKENVKLFPQAMMPAIDMKTGKVLLESPASIALSPNGHGGSLKALYASGAIAEMKKRGIEQISYTQVDNPIVRIIDPLFLGLHALDRCEMSSKMLPKAYPKEKLGNFCLIDGRMTVIEYSDLPDELAEQRLPNGDLRFRAGSIAIHAIRVDFVESLNTRPGGFALPFHRAEKKVPHIDIVTKQPVEPKSNNAVKLETFVFDALPLCERSIIYETDRLDEFAPIKNADQEGVAPIDTPNTSKARQTLRAAGWLEKAGVKVARNAKGEPDAVIEISQLTAIYAEDLKKAKLPAKIDAGAKVVL